MSLKHAILTLLDCSEKSGYDLMKDFDSSMSHFWQASHQQIYKTLADMEIEGWVGFHTEVQIGKPDKKLYVMTDVGRQALIDWVQHPGKPPAVREELLVKLRAVDVVGVKTLISVLQQEQAHCRAVLAVYEGIREQYYAGAPASLTTAAKRASWLTLRRGVTSTQVRLEWLEEAVALLER